jgi:hypothetical protein
MESLSNLLQNRPIERGTEKITSERQLLIKDFMDRLNADARASKGKYKEKPASFYATKVAHLSTVQLREFYQDCSRARNFGAYFYWSLKPKQ